jgi:asparagine N-glycosylation enzyme membrane subunit Stt3
MSQATPLQIDVVRGHKSAWTRPVKAARVLSRKQPEKHRAMMLLRNLSILAGATVRMPVLFPIVGEAGWVGIFGPVFTLGAVFLLVRSLKGRAFDRWLATGYAVMVVIYIGACRFAESDAWSQLAKSAFNT